MDHATAARWRVPALVAALTAIAIAIVWAVRPAGTHVARATAAGKPPVLKLLPGAADAPARLAAVAENAAKIAGPGGPYVLSGTLGSGPARAAVLGLGAPASADVDRLAAAFGLPAAKRGAGGWVATDGKHQLSVQASGGGNWWYGQAPDCADGDPESSGCAVSGAVVTAPDAVAASGAGSATSSVGPPTGSTAVDGAKTPVGPATVSAVATADDATVRRAAAGILAAAGVQLDRAHVVVQFGSLTVDPLVKGLPTSGVQTSVSVDPAGTVQWANGWLGALTDGDTYPLITAAEAFKQLEAQPRMMMLPCRMGTQAADDPAVGGPAVDIMPCTDFTPDPVEVTGGTFGWSAQWLADNRVVLAPSWLFTMKGTQDWPTAIIAIDPVYLTSTGVPTGKGAGNPAPDAPTAVPGAVPAGSGGSAPSPNATTSR
jgi:hypothetical protein